MTHRPTVAVDALPLVELVLDDARWEAAGLEAIAERAAQAALATLGLPPENCEISLLAASDSQIAALNLAFRGKSAPTNVLSWPAFNLAMPGRLSVSEDPPVFLGDLALAFETCAREAEEAGIVLADHAAHLVVHGVLHLLGYDHSEDKEAEVMEAIEVKALASIGVADPYDR